LREAGTAMLGCLAMQVGGPRLSQLVDQVGMHEVLSETTFHGRSSCLCLLGASGKIPKLRAEQPIFGLARA
jgi:hypothetical protein